MNVENLATVMGINLLKPQIEDPFTVMKGGGAHKHTGTSAFTWENWSHDGVFFFFVFAVMSVLLTSRKPRFAELLIC